MIFFVDSSGNIWDRHVQSICQTSFKIHNVRIQGCNLAKLRIWSALFGETETKRSHEECQELLFWCFAMNSVIN